MNPPKGVNVAVTITTSNFQFLKSIGISPSLIDVLVSHKIKLAIGVKGYAFLQSYKEGGVSKSKVIGGGNLPVTVNELMKGDVPEAQKKSIAMIVEQELIKVCATLGATVSQTSTSLAVPVDATDNPFQPIPLVKPVVKSYIKNHDLTVIPLADSNKLYDTVRGTSSDSVYVTIAIGQGVKIAARIHDGTGLSLRAEGKLSGHEWNALQGQGFKMSGAGHASLHLSCVNVSTDRVVGAVLLGSGIEFTTVMPSMKKVKELCK